MPWVMAGGLVVLTSILAIREYEKEMKAPVRIGHNHYMARDHFDIAKSRREKELYDRMTSRIKSRRGTKKSSHREGVVDLTSKSWGGK